MKFPLIRIVKAIFGVLGTHGPAFARIEAKVDQILKERMHLKELALEIDAELLQDDIGPRTRELLRKVRQGLAFVP